MKHKKKSIIIIVLLSIPFFATSQESLTVKNSRFTQIVFQGDSGAFAKKSTFLDINRSLIIGELYKKNYLACDNRYRETLRSISEYHALYDNLTRQYQGIIKLDSARYNSLEDYCKNTIRQQKKKNTKKIIGVGAVTAAIGVILGVLVSQ